MLAPNVLESVQTLGDAEVQTQPDSILHELEHPSPSKVFPSSHSNSNLKPSPHT
jgi:hypothetical protein